MSIPQVLLAEAEDGPGFSVTVCPPADIGHDAVFPDYITARTYARRLRWAHGWELVDRVDTRTRKAAEEREILRIETKRAKLSISGR